MTFLAPAYLWLLICIAAGAVAYLLLLRRLHYPPVTSPNHSWLTAIVRGRSGRVRHLPPAMLMAGLAAIVLGLAKPVRDVLVRREEPAVVVLAIDVSVSMLAQDVLPSRMEAAQAAALDFMDTLLPEMYAGVVSFDFRAKVEAEPTRDRAMVRARLEALRPGAGTAAGNALLAALELITASRSAQSGTGSTPEDGGIEGAAIILLSDGATTSGVPVKKAAAKVAERGVPVFTIAFGTDTGTIDSTGASADRRTMMEVASMTGGAFFEAASSETLRAIYADLGTQVGFDRQQRAYGKALLWAGLALLTLAVALAWRTHRQIVL